MTTRISSRPLLGLGVALLCLGVGATAMAAKEPPQTTEDGLELRKTKKVDLLYVRPGATLTGYTKIMMDPVQVAFSKSWDPRDYGGSTFGLKTSDVERIRNGVGELARDTFVKVLNKGGYPEVKAADAGVLRLSVYIVDLYVNAPDTMQPGRNRSFSAEAGHMTLGIELRDSVTGTLMARALDRSRSTGSDRFTWASGVSNRAEAERILTGWALKMKDALDAAKEP